MKQYFALNKSNSIYNLMDENHSRGHWSTLPAHQQPVYDTEELKSTLSHVNIT